jgi:hypothetical protein
MVCVSNVQVDPQACKQVKAKVDFIVAMIANEDEYVLVEEVSPANSTGSCITLCSEDGHRG